MATSQDAKARISLGAAAALLAAVVAMSWVDAAGKGVVFGRGPILAVGTLTVLAFVGYFAFKTSDRPADAPEALTSAEGQVRASFAHLVRPAAVLVLVLGSAATVRACLVPDSWGQYASYRGNALKEAMFASEPLHVGERMCVRCHQPNVTKHDKDVHNKVECESCHGPGARHLPLVVDRQLEAKEERPFVPKTKDPCLWCHRRLNARPSRFPQIDPEEHYAFLGVTEPDTPCMRCHDPHEPLYLSSPVQQARLHPGIQLCRDCHTEDKSPTERRPENHPVVFECRYCHGEIADDFANRPHAGLDCRRCHVYFPESENAGRIIKNEDPRFCLLCHRATPFRKQGSIPLVDWPAHADAQQPSGNASQCVECHRAAIHSTSDELRQRVRSSL
jgi:hypothetical protein